jgi:hypothetical protein
VPVSGTFCGLAAALSVTFTEPCRTPFVLGWNLTSIVQLPLGIRLLGQLLVWLNEPVTEILLMRRVHAPLFVSFTGCALLVVKTDWVGFAVPVDIRYSH